MACNVYFGDGGDCTACHAPKSEHPYRYTETERRILTACAAMPYGGSVHKSPRHSRIGEPAKPLDLKHIADYLEELQDVLRGAAESSEADRRELGELRSDLRGFRRVLGIGALLDAAVTPEWAKMFGPGRCQAVNGREDRCVLSVGHEPQDHDFGRAGR